MQLAAGMQALEAAWRLRSSSSMPLAKQLLGELFV
jgi:hypothetical protein